MVQTTSETDLQILIAKREQMFTKIQLLFDLTKTLPSEKDKSKISNFRVRYDQLEVVYKNYQDVTERINILHLSINPKGEIDFQALSSFEELYFHIKAFHSKYFPVASSSTNPGHDSTSSSANQARPRLPKIELPKFDSTLKNWSFFYDKFKSLIHDNTSLNDVDKFHYLLSVVSGPALSILKSLPLTATNYPIIWNSLVDKYQNKRVLGTDLLDSLFNFKCLNTESIAGFNNFLFTFKDSVTSLKALQIPDLSDFMLSYMALQCLPEATRKQFELEFKSKELPPFDSILEFVQNQVTALEVSKHSDLNKIKTFDKKPFTFKSHLNIRKAFTTSSTFSSACPVCKKHGHTIYFCTQYSRMTPEQRKKQIRDLRYCFNCLKGSHMLDSCPSNITCSFCNNRHHSTLCLANNSVSTRSPNKQSSIPQTSFSTNNKPSTSFDSKCHFSTSALYTGSTSNKTVLLGTALIQMRDNCGTYQPVRALIDSGAQSSFITSSCLQRLGLPVRKCNLPIAGLGQSYISDIKGMTTCTLKPRDSDSPILSTDAVILSTITTSMPSVNIPSNISRRFEHLKLADPLFNKPSKIDFLIAGDLFPLLYDGQRILGKRGTPSALHSIFGWVITGEVNYISALPTIINHVSSSDVPLDELLKKFWECEEVPNISNPDPDDIKCEHLFNDLCYRTNEGRYVVPLPFRHSQPLPIINNFSHAVSRLSSVERRLLKDPQLYKDYHNFLSDYERLGHMTVIRNSTFKTKSTYFIPHHAVIKESSSTTKLRVVFDGSSKPPHSPSLNSLLLTGPKLQQDIIQILCRFRTHPFVFTCDISKMYRQILVRPEDRLHQHILWRREREGPIQDFELNTVTYGLSSSPYLALRVLRKLASDEGHRYPNAVPTLLEDVFLDDFLTGADTFDAARQLKFSLIKLLSLGGFELRKWSSNNPLLIDDVPSDHLETPLSFDTDGNAVIKVLGLQWNPTADAFTYKIKTSKLSCTKRTILSHIARVYDPLGWLSPVIFKSKCLIQQLWHLGLDWDEPVPDFINYEWNTYYQQLDSLSKINIPRYLLQSSVTSVYLVGFSDASEKGYSSVVYLVCSGPATTKSHLLLAKSKVSPLKTLSIPRLELNGALLLSRLLGYLMSILSRLVSVSAVYAFSDSTTVLSWLKTSPHLLKTYVANRVTQILSNISPESWYHVRSESNPADCSSRGLYPSQILNFELWWQGPPWLVNPLSEWPILRSFSKPEVLLEYKNSNVIHSFHSSSNSNILSEIIARHSSFINLQRVVAWCIRFKCNLKLSQEFRSTGPLSYNELRQAEILLVRSVQREHYRNDINFISNDERDKCLPCVRRLDPFLDDYGVLRVGGRIKHASLPYPSLHPIILPKSCHLSSILVDHYHLKYLHVGPRALQSLILRRFWILAVRSVIRSRLSKCIVCFKAKASPDFPFMGDLPRPRVTQGRPFINVGIDFGGPFATKESTRRNAHIIKSYVCLFVCFSTKAIHLEVVSDLSTDAFLACLDRFIARRGLCKNIHSDCGTNFVGANHYLRDIYKLLKNSNTVLTRKLADMEINWHFNPGSAPHFGGLFEAGIKSTKYHLRRIVQNRALTFEEYTTLFAKIESILNSRPLCVLSNSPNEIDVLTPGHFLTGGPLVMPPEHDLNDIKVNRLNRWQLIRQANQHFWNLWSRDYLHTLQQRNKWSTSCSNLKIGDLVLLVEKSPTLQWPTAIIDDVHPGADGIVRVATVRTNQGTYRRPVAKLCPLPLT